MTTFPYLQQALPPLLSWIKHEALPFWGSVGVDHARGGFHERLDLQGKPIVDVPKRLMVQGRQLYVYSHAGLLGWYPDARRLADECVNYLLKSFYQRDGNPGWVYSLAPDGGVASGDRDLYAHAFVLLGLSWYYRLTADRRILKIVDETLTFLDTDMASSRGGYFDAIPRPDAIRRQNPHMHLFESCIALYQATQDPRYLACGAKIFELFSSSFFRPDGGWLCEYFTDDLIPLSDLRGRISEPGHHYEWIWLLRQFEIVSECYVGPYCTALYNHADRYGWDQDGFIVDEVDPDGAIMKGSRRIWPHTEALKANIVEGEHGKSGCDQKATQCVERLMKSYLGSPVTGGWIDHINENGHSVVSFVPASTFYHIFCATAEAALRLDSEPSLDRQF